MSSAPTSAGEMIGYLRLDPSDWQENSDKVKLDAKELGRLNPHIRVDVDASRALTQLAAVAAATKRLQDAQGSVSVAQAKLNELREKGGASTAKLAAAEETLAKAMRAEQVASIALASAHENVGKAANDAEKDLTDLAGAAAQGSSKMLLLGGAIGVAAVAAGPLLAVAGAGLASLALGAGGLVDTIKGALSPAFHDLQKDATAALLQGGAGDAIDHLQSALPKLTPLVNFFGQEVGKVGDEFATWLDKGGIKSFTEYAKQAFPAVESLAHSALNAIGAFLVGTKQSGIDTINTLSSALGIFATVQDLQNKIPKTPTGATGLKGIGEGIIGQFTGNPQGLQHAASSGLGLLNQGLGKLPGLLESGGSSFISLFQNKKPKTPAVVGPGLASVHGAVNDIDPASVALLTNSKALGTTVDAYQSAKDAAAAFKTTTDANTLAMQLENNATGILSQALSGLNGNYLGVASSDTAFHSAITSINASLKENGTTLDINTAKGQANRQSIEQAVSAAQQHAQAIAQQTGSTKAATDAYNTDISTLEKQLGATGLAKDKIDEYITSIDKIPPLKRTQLEIDASLQVTAANLGQSVHDAINSIPAAAAKNKKADGGWIGGVGGSRSDSNLILASRGEFVVSAKYAQLYGPALQSLNSGKGLPAVAVPGKKVDVNVYPAAGMDERSVGKYTATYVESVMV